MVEPIVRRTPVWLKPLVEYGPLAAFFIAYQLKGLMPATGVLVGVTILATLVWVISERRIPWLPVITAAVVGLFGGLTLYFQDDTFIKIKPTVVETFMGLGLLGGAARDKWFLKSLLSKSVSLEDRGWRILTYRFAVFFLILAVANELVWRTQPEQIWVNFKVFGLSIATFLFTACQFPLFKRYGIEEVAEKDEAGEKAAGE